MSAFSELDRMMRQATHVQKITQPVQETIDQLWSIAQDVAFEDGVKYAALRNAIAWLEVLRAG